MTNDIDSIMQETRRYWYEDGFAEIAIGALFGILSIVLIAQDVFRDRPEWLVTSIIGVTIITAFGGFVVRGWAIWCDTSNRNVNPTETSFAQCDFSLSCQAASVLPP